MFKRVLSLILALVLCGAMAVTGIGETEEPAEAEVAAETEAEAVEEPEAAEETEEAEAAPATLEEALARIAELEALLEQYKPVYDEQVIVEYDGGIVLRDEVMKVYQQYVDMFAQYGLDLASYGMDQQYKEQSADEVLEKKILEAKAVELGADQLSDEELDEIAQSAQKTFDGYVESVASQMAEKQGVDVTDEIRQSAVDYLNNLGGYSVSDIEASLKENAVTENLYEMVTADVEVTEEDVRATYDAEVERQQESYADSYTYINDRDNGTQIVWNPAGYRAVKQVLIKFDDDQSAKYKELNDKKTALEAELAELLEPAEEEPAEEEAEPRTEAEIRADLDSVDEALEALYAELLPTAQEVVDKYNAGTPFADLIAEYNEDPGMQNEPTATLGYAVCTDNNVWDPAFTEGAMSLENVGDITEPIKGSYGYYIICYDSDITAGEVEYESVRDTFESKSLESKITDTYNAAVQQWIEEANPVRYYDRLA